MAVFVFKGDGTMTESIQWHDGAFRLINILSGPLWGHWAPERGCEKSAWKKRHVEAFLGATAYVIKNLRQHPVSEDVSVTCWRFPGSPPLPKFLLGVRRVNERHPVGVLDVSVDPVFWSLAQQLVQMPTVVNDVTKAESLQICSKGVGDVSLTSVLWVWHQKYGRPGQKYGLVWTGPDWIITNRTSLKRLWTC